MVKNPAANAGDAGNVGSIPGSGRSLGEGNGNLLQYSCLENPMDRGAWQATVQRVTKSWTQINTKVIIKKEKGKSHSRKRYIYISDITGKVFMFRICKKFL